MPRDTAGVVGQEWWDERVERLAKAFFFRPAGEIVSKRPGSLTEIQNDRNTKGLPERGGLRALPRRMATPSFRGYRASVQLYMRIPGDSLLSTFHPHEIHGFRTFPFIRA